MNRIKWIVFFVVLTLLMTFTLTATIAASSLVNPEKGPPEFNKIVFVHYPKGMAPGKPEGTPGNGPQEKEYIYSGYHWADAAIPVNYYANLSGISGNNMNNFRSGIQSGFQVWENNPNSYIDFTYIGDTALGISSLNDDMDGYNVVGWANLSSYPNAIAVTQFWYNIVTKELAEVDLALNSDPQFLWWQNSAGETWIYADTSLYDVDVQNIIAHEAGHWLVLDDLYADSNTDKTMYGYSDQMELIKRSLASGDEAGIQAIYPITPSEQGIMHVGNINMVNTKSGPNYTIYTEVTVLDAGGVAVPAATVNIETLLPDSSAKSYSGETNIQGVITFKLRSKQTGTYTSTVTGISKDGWTYSSANNTETTDSWTIQ